MSKCCLAVGYGNVILRIMEKKIIDILLKHSSELKMKSGIMAEPEIEDWLWSGEFEKVAQEIVKLFEMRKDRKLLIECVTQLKHIDEVRGCKPLATTTWLIREINQALNSMVSK